MRFTQIAQYVLPPIVIDVAHWLVAGRRLPRPEAEHVRPEDAGGPEGTPAQGSMAMCDGDGAQYSAARAVPVVRDTLEALTLIDVPDVHVLDVGYGCGHGDYQARLAACAHTAHWEYTGMAISPAWMEFVEDHRFLPVADNAFDVVLASGVLQYLPNPGMTLAELRRVTRTYVLVSRLPTWQEQDVQIMMHHRPGVWGDEQYALHVFNRPRVEALFGQAGFAVLWRDYGSASFILPGGREPLAHISYLLRKT